MGPLGFFVIEEMTAVIGRCLTSINCQLQKSRDGYDVPLIEEEEKTLPEFEGADKTVEDREKLL